MVSSSSLQVRVRRLEAYATFLLVFLLSVPRVPVSKISDYLGLIRFSHTVFALPFAAMAMILAWSTPRVVSDQYIGDSLAAAELAYPVVRWTDLAGVLLCMVFARSAAMAINRLLDHHIDAVNPRTASRHLPAGILTRSGVVAFTIITSVGFVLSTLLFLPNWLPLVASVPVLLFLCGYSLAKRFTAMAHVWLGAALSLSPICVWVAIRGVQSASAISDYAIPLTLAAVVATWVTGFDVLYACQDADFDRGSGLHSIPAKFGIAGALRFAAGCHFVMIPLLFLLAWVGTPSGLGWIFLSATGLVAAMVIWQHQLVRPNDLSRVNQAFFQANAIISVLLLVAVAIDCVL